MYAYHRPGPGGLPLGLASSEGLGVAVVGRDMAGFEACSLSEGYSCDEEVEATAPTPNTSETGKSAYSFEAAAKWFGA